MYCSQVVRRKQREQRTRGLRRVFFKLMSLPERINGNHSSTPNKAIIQNLSAHVGQTKMLQTSL